MQERNINGNLVIENGTTYRFEGNLTINNGTLIIRNGNLSVGGVLTVNSKYAPIDVVDGIIHAKSIVATVNINSVNSDIFTFDSLNCKSIFAKNGDIVVGSDSNVGYVSCRNYLVYGKNDSLSIEADGIVNIRDFSSSYAIRAYDVFLGNGGNFNGGTITAAEFDFKGHVYNCWRRYTL